MASLKQTLYRIKKTPLKKRKLRIIKNLKNYALKNALIKTMVMFNQKGTFTGDTIFAGHKKEDILKALDTTGIYDFGKVFSDEQINDILEKIKDKDCYFNYNPSLPHFKKENAPEDVNIANYPVNDFLSEDIFLKLIYDPLLLDTMQDFLWAKPVLNNLTLYWSMLGKEVPRQAQMYHRDSTDVRFLVLSMYLTDVDTGNDGPFTFVKHSNKSNKLHLSKLRHSDEVIEKTFGKENVLEVLGKKGTVILSDNWGYHKGKLPVSKERCMFFSTYGISMEKVPNVQQLVVTDKEKCKKIAPYERLIKNMAYKLAVKS